MNAPQLLASAHRRIRRPGTWGAVALFGGLWNGLRWFAGPDHLPAGEFLLPFVFGILALGLAAVPWQWTGDERPAATVLRGLAQALPWNALLLVPLILLLPGHEGRGGRGAASFPLLPGLPPRMLILLVACGAFGLLAGWILADRDQEALRAEVQARRAETEARLARNAQARALQAQMNPHVLYNTLSGLAELARQDGRAAEEALVDLSGLTPSRRAQNSMVSPHSPSMRAWALKPRKGPKLAGTVRAPIASSHFIEILLGKVDQTGFVRVSPSR